MKIHLEVFLATFWIIYKLLMGIDGLKSGVALPWSMDTSSLEG